LLNKAFREEASGEESRYGLSKRTDLLRVGVAFRAAKSEAREEELGVVVDVVGVWPLNCADRSSYCLRSLGSWVERSDVLFPLVSVTCSLCLTSLSWVRDWVDGEKGRLTLHQHLPLQPAHSRFPDPREEIPKIGL
jgi:hypothetical protein